MFCYKCGAKVLQGDTFCCWCGTNLQERKAETESENASASDNSFITQTGRLIRRMGMMNFFDGEPALGFPSASGIVCIYDDRLEFEKKLGDSKGAFFGLAGMAVARNMIKNDPIEVYYFKDIKSVRTGTYTLYTTFVLELKSGQTMSFVPMVPGSQIAVEMCKIVTQYI